MTSPSDKRFRKTAKRIKTAEPSEEVPVSKEPEADVTRLRARVLYYYAKSLPAVWHPMPWRLVARLLEMPLCGASDIKPMLSDMPLDVEIDWDVNGLYIFGSIPVNAPKPMHNDVKEIFEYWRQRTERSTRVKLTRDRVNKIRARLKEGYSVDTMKAAVDGIMRSEFHVGNNDTGRVYTGIEHVFKSGSHVETFSGMDGVEPKKDKQPVDTDVIRQRMIQRRGRKRRFPRT